MKSLEQVLADARGDAAVLRKQGHAAQADSIERVCGDVAEAAHEFIAWLSEGEAQLRSGRSAAWLRRQFAEWEHAGHARKDRRQRQYRMLIVPRRADLESARQAGRAAARSA